MKKEIHYHFVGNAATGDDLQEIRSLKWDEGIVACTRHTWVWPLYCQLKMRGWPVSFSYELKEGAVNIIHGEVARWQLKASDINRYFIVGVRADFRPFPYGHYEIVQNKRYAGGRRIYMPLFSQPGLIARDPGRGEQVVNICIAGRLQNSIEFSRLQKDLQNIGCRFVFKGEGEWQDMCDVDVLLGIRSFSKRPYHSKPPTKLLNAWHAGIPFLGGYDSAYTQVGEPGKNYFQVSSYEELIGVVRLLQEDKSLYQMIVENGQSAAFAYTTGKITEMWEHFLETKVCPDFIKWRDGRDLRVVPKIKSLVFELFEQKIRGYGRYCTWSGVKG